MTNNYLLLLLLLLVVQFLALLQTEVVCSHYKVGDLHSWGIPSSANSEIYTKWSKYHIFKLGDSLLFLYPPSEDSVVQVTEESFETCNLKDPILYMNNGNSVFNITKTGHLFFTSGKSGHCEKKQKLHISVATTNGGNATQDIISQGPSYPTVFGSIPQPPSSSSPFSSSSSSTFCSLFMTILAIQFVISLVRV